MTTATLRLRADQPTELQPLAADLDRALNRPGEPIVTVVGSGDVLAFECSTWVPILRSRVEDALDQLVGPGWRATFRTEAEYAWDPKAGPDPGH